MDSVYFSWNEYENLSNFSAHQILYNNIIFPTCEHLYHYLRYNDINIQNKILSARSPFLAHKISQEHKNSQIDIFWEIKVKIMKKIFLLKIEQHKDVLLTLINSSNNLIIKQHPLDYYWWVWSDNSWKNIMWKLWKEVRSELSN
jgi:GTP cyclohydrolase II